MLGVFFAVSFAARTLDRRARARPNTNQHTHHTRHNKTTTQPPNSIAEMFNVEVTFDPKPIPGDWNGAGGHVNFSNNDTRADGTGWDAIQAQIAKLEKKHALHIAQYGEGNERRLTGYVRVLCVLCVLCVL